MQRRPKIFVGSSGEGLNFARGVFSALSHDPYDVYPWNLIFREGPMLTNSEQLSELSTFDFGIIIFTPDDLTISREVEQVVPRDNLIYELGLLVGFLGRERVFPIIPRHPKIHLPSDLLGINPLPFEFGNFDSATEYERVMTYACDTIRHTVSRIGSRTHIVGQTAQRHQSGIIIHDSISFSFGDKALRFRVGYQGSGSLLNVQLRCYHTIYTNIGGRQEYTRSWNEIPLDKDFVPEMQIAWRIRHDLSENSCIIKMLDNPEPSLEGLRNIDGQIVLYVNGTDSLSMTPQFNRHFFNLSDVTDRKFADFYTLSPSPRLFENIDWKLFNELE